MKGKTAAKPTPNKPAKSTPSTSSSSTHHVTSIAGSKKKRPRSESSAQEAADSQCSDAPEGVFHSSTPCFGNMPVTTCKSDQLNTEKKCRRRANVMESVEAHDMMQ
jgi:hypothetical protein